MYSLLEGARRACGALLLIDVFRAFTTACVAFSRGAEKIIFVAEIEEALDLKARGIGSLCVGGVGSRWAGENDPGAIQFGKDVPTDSRNTEGRTPPRYYAGFDLSNSPYEMTQADVAGATLIYRTRAGAGGVVAATNASRLYICSLVNAGATVKAVLADAPDIVSIVAMGYAGDIRTDEDEVCALYLRNLLEGRASDHRAVRSLAAAGGAGADYPDPSKPWYDPMDAEIALRIDSHPFPIRVEREDGLMVARAVEPTASR